MFSKEFYTHLENESLTEIKGGTARETFLEIWMVAVDQRVFARSWNKSARSWFTEFQKTGVGQVKYGDTVLDVTGKQLPANDSLQPRVSEAYITRFTEPENVKYAQGIAKPEYFDYTMELMLR